MKDTVSVVIKMDPERMIFHTSNEGFYEFVEGVVAEQGLIDNLEEIKEVAIVPEGVEDEEVVLRVYITDYTTMDEDEDEDEESEDEEE